MLNDSTRTICFRFKNSFTGNDLFYIRMPYLAFYANSGYYQRLFKNIKQIFSFEAESGLLKCSFGFRITKEDRIIMFFESGALLDLPYDVNAEDLKIVNHYLTGLKMAKVFTT